MNYPINSKQEYDIVLQHKPVIGTSIENRKRVL